MGIDMFNNIPCTFLCKYSPCPICLKPDMDQIPTTEDKQCEFFNCKCKPAEAQHTMHNECFEEWKKHSGDNIKCSLCAAPLKIKPEAIGIRVDKSGQEVREGWGGWKPS